MHYIYNFPEIKPKLWVGNMDWFRNQQLFQKKLSELHGVERIIINGPFFLYEELQEKFQTRSTLPILSREEVGPILPLNTLSLYFVENQNSMKQFTIDFHKRIGEYGEILSLE
jgi:hypothetical protein